MSWLLERVESKTGRTVRLPPRNEPWLPERSTSPRIAGRQYEQGVLNR